MNVGDSFVLPPDVVLAPVAELPDDLRKQIGDDEADVAVMRPGSREPMRVLDADAAALVERFRREQPIVDAVIDYSRSTGTDPERTLEDAYPMLQRLIAARMLVAADSDEAEAMRSSLQLGDSFAGHRIVASVQFAEDTEVYQATDADGHYVALKIARGPSADRHPLFDREAEALRGLDSDAAPRLLGEGVEAGRRYLALEWRAGTPATAAAAELRASGGPAAVVDLCVAILDAYAGLHARGILHGDVHPNNVIVGDGLTVTVLDYGLAVRPGSEDARAVRGGVAFFMDPEQARAARAGLHSPPLTVAAEQYSLAALAYLLLTGTHHTDFSLERTEMLRQIAEEPPVPLPDRGVAGLEEAERVLVRALAKGPEARYPGIAEFRDALAAAARTDAGHRPRARVISIDANGGEAVDAVLSRVGLDGPLLAGETPEAPTCSVNYGSAGIAYALLRAARQRSDPALLALAEVWVAKALAHLGDESAFVNEEIDATPDILGPIAPLHTAAGVHCVRALVAHAAGDENARRLGVAGFLAASEEPCENLDLALGRSSTVLACAQLLEAGVDAVEAGALRALGTRTLASVWEEVSEMGPVGSGDGVDYLGVAHGWAGLAYAALRWRAATPDDRSPPIRRRLEELAACAEPWGRGLRWRVAATPAGGSPVYMSGWCNGSAGHVHLWTLAHALEPDERWLRLARGAGWNAWEADEPVNIVCCGRAGRAYALLNLHRATGEPEWLERARAISTRAAAGPAVMPNVPGTSQDSLYKGRLGVALLSLELASDPSRARMPFFEDEGWRKAPVPAAARAVRAP